MELIQYGWPRAKSCWSETDKIAVNGMFFDRGAAVDYDAWAFLGNPGWKFADLLPYFEKVWYPPCDPISPWNTTPQQSAY